MEPKPRGLTRREFIKYMVLCAGAGALGPCASPPKTPVVPTASDQPPTAPFRSTDAATATNTAIPRVNLISDVDFLSELESRGITNNCAVDAPLAQALSVQDRTALIQPAKDALLRNPRFPGTVISCAIDTNGRPAVYYTDVDGKLYVPHTSGQLLEAVLDQNGTLSTPTPEAIVAPYPTDTRDFILGAGGEEITREQIAALDEFGYTESALQKLEAWWSGKLPAGAEFVYEIIPGKGWRAVPQTQDGKFIIPKYTKGDEEGLLESGLMPVRYLYKSQTELQKLGDDFFEGIVVKDPQELVGKGRQQIIKTTTGHFIVGFMNADGSLYAWLDAVHDKWEFTEAGTKAAATPTPQPTKRPTQPPTQELQPTATPDQQATPTTQSTVQPASTETGVNCGERAAAFCQRTVEGRAFGTTTYIKPDGTQDTSAAIPGRPWGEYGPVTFPPNEKRIGTVHILARVISINYSSGDAVIDAGSLGQKTIHLAGAQIDMWGRYYYPNPNGYGYVSDGFRSDVQLIDIAGESPLNEGHGDMIFIYLYPQQFGIDDVFWFNQNNPDALNFLKTTSDWIVSFARISQ